MYYRTLFPRDLFAEFDRLQHEMRQSFDPNPNIRGLTRGFPALNVGGTSKAVDIYAFAPGIDPATLDVQLVKGMLTIAGERKAEPLPEKAARHIEERFSGRFQRVVSLPDDVDPNAIEARYRDGVLHVSIQRKQESQARRITIQ
ncbi:heat-shock protein Hsp20 [Betaproteobacteria bacterium]|nr:heat-shock protein Hsp20 [Betaproteobacteria bacterium]